MTLYFRRFAGLTSLLLKRASFQRCSMGPVGARASSSMGCSRLYRKEAGRLLHEAEEHGERQKHVARRDQKSEPARHVFQALVVTRVTEADQIGRAHV